MIRRIRRSLDSFARDCSGASALEYALLIVGIGVAVMAAVNFVSAELVRMQTTVAEAIDDQ